MEKHSVILSLLFSLFCVSCAFNESQDIKSIEERKEKQIFMYSEEEYMSSEKQEVVSPLRHKDFFSVSIQNMLDQNRSSQQTKGRCAPGDVPTPIETEEIPIWRYSSYSETVYQDGSLEFTAESNLISDEKINAILAIGASSVDFSQIPSKINFSNGQISMYNRDNDLLYEGMYPMPNMQEYVDSVAYYMKLYEEYMSTEVKAGGINGVDLLKSAIDASGETNSVVKELFDGKIVLEQQINNSTKRIRSVLSDDLTRTYLKETYDGDQLQYRVTYSYDSKEEGQFVSKNALSGFTMAKPTSIITQVLLIRNGVPFILTETKVYSKNISIIYTE